MTRLAVRHGAINLAQGFPDFPAPEASEARRGRSHRRRYQSVRHHLGRQAVPRRHRRQVPAHLRHGVRSGTRNHGLLRRHRGHDRVACWPWSTPGDEVVLFEPFYENYGPDTQLCGAVPRYVTLHAPDWSFDPDELRAAFSPRTKAIILNSPNNPTGKVFSRQELEFIAGLCQEFDALAITDEIYEHILYDGAVHIPIMSLPGMRDRSILVNSMSKTYSVTGWRVGWVLASPDLTDSIRKVHDFLTVGAAAPLQQAGVVALSLPDDYYTHLSTEYAARRDHIVE